MSTANGGIIGPTRTINVASISGVWSTSQMYIEQTAGTWPGSRPPVAGYIGWYVGEASLSGTSWLDLSGNGNHATVTRGSVIGGSDTGNGCSKTVSYIEGNANGGLRFPAAILPSTYTLFFVARYTGGSRRRIMDGIAQNWLSGFWGGGTGIAHHNGWLTGQPDTHGNNWFISTDQNNLYRSNKVTRGSSGAGSPSNDQLSINHGNYGETSDWQVAEVIVYNSTLSSDNYILVEDYLNRKYGFGL